MCDKEIKIMLWSTCHVADKQVTWGVFFATMLIAGIVLMQVLSMSERIMCAENINEDQSSSSIKIVPRADWHARPPRQVSWVPRHRAYVVIHHSYTPPACYTKSQCSAAMRRIQSFHMDHRKWWDIGYNFAVGSDKTVYEGRGWGVAGAHALDYSNVSVSICLIGDWNKRVPPHGQLKAVKKLIRLGVKEGWISKQYNLIGHRQLRDTSCPGDALYNEIRTWDHYTPYTPFEILEIFKKIENSTLIIKPVKPTLNG